MTWTASSRSCGTRTQSGAADDRRSGPGGTRGQNQNKKMEFILDQINQDLCDTIVGSIFSGAAAYPELAGASLLEAMSFEGGEDTLGAARILLRTAASAVICASHPDVLYPRSAEQVVAAVNSALASGERATMLKLAKQFASSL